MFYFQPKIFGMDVGFETLKVVQLGKQLSGFKVWGKIEIPLPASSINKNGIANIDLIAKTLNEGLAKAKPKTITGKNVHAALPESLTYTKTIIVPLKNPREIQKSIAIQAADVLPVSPEEVYKDYVITKQSEQTSEILLIAQNKSLVDNFVELTEKANLRLARLETKQLALARLFIPHLDQSNLLFVDIGSKVSKISLFEHGDLTTTATTAVGATNINNEISLKQLATSIIKLPQFRANQTGRAITINAVKLTGAGVTGNDSLAEDLQIKLKLPVDVAKPVVNIAGFEHKFAVATGLALDGIK